MTVGCPEATTRLCEDIRSSERKWRALSLEQMPFLFATFLLIRRVVEWPLLPSGSSTAVVGVIDFVFSSETIVKVIDLDDTTKIKLLDGHKKGVRGVSWHPSEALIVSYLLRFQMSSFKHSFLDNLRIRREAHCLGCV